jgi:hypothetical protein
VLADFWATPQNVPALHNGKSGVRSRRKPLQDSDVSEFSLSPIASADSCIARLNLFVAVICANIAFVE